MLESSNVSVTPSWILWCIEGEGSFTAFGSRKINQIDLEAASEYYDYTIFNSPFCSTQRVDSGPIRYNMSGSLRGFTMATGRTELEAVCSLITAFREEERREKELFVLKTKEDEEAIRIRLEAKKLEDKNLRKKHKKTMKARREGKFDVNYCPAFCVLCEEERNQQEEYYDTDWHDYADEY